MADGLKRVLDYSDYVSAPEDGNRYEVIEGALHVTPAPRPLHQRISLRLEVVLHGYFSERSLGEVFHAPIDLILGDNDILQPDILVVGDRTQISDRGVEGPPLLVVEILSGSTEGRDRGVKARRYAEFGIVHYWLVDGVARRIDCFRLRDGVYEAATAASAEAVLVHPDFAGLAVNLSDLWADSEAPLPPAH